MAKLKASFRKIFQHLPENADSKIKYFKSSVRSTFWQNNTLGGLDELYI
ncbi:hypothetical protein [Tychonema sp. BBK16]|nr:hypothetical protein [Tychonema sp. BBK16]MCF6373752.1 hypothetical protein [Tychonema sp. BBK16]